jgi:hypothetical protein
MNIIREYEKTFERSATTVKFTGCHCQMNGIFIAAADYLQCLLALKVNDIINGEFYGDSILYRAKAHAEHHTPPVTDNSLGT